MRRLLPVGLTALTLGAPGILSAQDGFFFKPPVVSLSLQAGLAVPSAQDDVFDLFTRDLTLDRSDFASASIGGEIGVTVAPRFDIVIGLSRTQSSRPSEFRDWVDNDDQPIEQVTTFRRIPLTLSARYYPFDRGHAVGRYAWIPTSLSPYVGAGAGVVWYKLTQDGDFVDNTTLEIFHDHLTSSGSTPSAHVFAGAQWWPLPRAGLTAEARYAWGSATLRDGFSEFESIDLRGFQWTAGVAARF
jgi:opacity protein-like surface antigen